MKRVFITSVKRGSDDFNLTGSLFEVNLDKGCVDKEVPILDPTLKSVFWNPRGGNRGVRGLKCYNGVLYVTTATTIKKYDSNLRFVGQINNSKFAGLHDIYVDQNGIIVISTIHDLAIRTSFKGRKKWEWYGSESEMLQNRLGFKGRNIKTDINFHKITPKRYQKYFGTERLHLSGLYADEERVWVLSGATGSLIQIKPEEKILFRDGSLNAGHDCLLRDGKIYLNSTISQTLLIFDQATMQHERSVRTNIYDVENIRQFATAGWQRGLAHYDKNIYLVGTSPLTIMMIDVVESKIIKTIKLDDDIKHCSYNICVTDNF